MMEGWAKIGQATKYAGVSKDTFEIFLKNGLRFVRLPSGTRLFKITWIDQFLENYEVKPNEVQSDVNEIVNEIIGDIA
jgi:hypothetical protein